ncbi:ComEC/Rec2 family competence protein [Porphyromonas sp.]|uniref:ComEC/Rec2 family competence protein n=1 Tax=Porphyromonas sp. TaxID=1924944 RepID=UPI0026DD7018|nr:ComEC/Rec2 family competence protein [Porphyromonas sp.]MDO4770895.1 ComEC/Rec2 family competence protein [Porphyromonas sp.]
MSHPPRPIRYGDRPAYKLMWGGLVGFALYLSGWLVGGAIVWALLCAFYLIRTFLKSGSERGTLQSIVWIGAWALLFGIYCEVRTPDIETRSKALTLYDTEVVIAYPQHKKGEMTQRVRAEVKRGQGAISTLLHIPSEQALTDSLLYGTRGTATLDLQPLSLMKSHGYATYLRSQGIEATAYLHRLSDLSPAPALTSRLMKWRAHLIRYFGDIAEGHMGERELHLLYALILGERSHLDNSDKALFAEAGVSHLLALSGFHLGVIYLVLSKLLRLLFPLHNRRKLRYIILLLSLVAYTLFTGAAPSTLRALLMSAIYLIARLIDRPADGIQTLSLTLVILWLINPWSIQSPGLILSASAVWGILVFFPLFESLLSPRHQVSKYLYQALCLTVSAQIGVVPWLLYYWGSGSLIPLWSTLPMTLLSVVIIPIGLITLILSLLSPGVWITPLLMISDTLAELMLQTSSFFARQTLPTATFTPHLALIPAYYILCHYLLYRPLSRYIHALKLRTFYIST